MSSGPLKRSAGPNAADSSPRAPLPDLLPSAVMNPTRTRPASPPAPSAAESAAPPEDRPLVLLYSDGACSGNPGPGGWGAILVDPGSGQRLEISGSDPQTTNNRMEMIAIIEGLRRLKRESRVRIVTDSRYVVDGMKSWIHSWRRNGWRTADKKPVKNQDLWQELSALESRHDLIFEWIRGHQGHAENERCDQMAVEAYRKLQGGPQR